MASLDPTVALAALADVDVKLAVKGLAWDLDLELLGDVGFVEGSAAVRADVGQGRLVDFVDLFGGRWLTVCFGAIVFARLAAWLSGIGLGLALGEGSSLALAGAGCLVELTAEALVLCLQVVDPSLKGLAVSTPDRFHAGIIRSRGACSCTGVRRKTVQIELKALIKYSRNRDARRPKTDPTRLAPPRRASHSHAAAPVWGRPFTGKRYGDETEADAD
jgi:hypothetical protein